MTEQEVPAEEPTPEQPDDAGAEPEAEDGDDEHQDQQAG